jgi:hypothetical protein
MNFLVVCYILHAVLFCGKKRSLFVKVKKKLLYFNTVDALTLL